MEDKIKEILLFLKKKLGLFMFFIGVGIILYLIKKVGLIQLWKTFIGLSFHFVLLAILMWIINLIISTIRFSRLLNAQVKFFELFKVYLYGNLLNYASAVQGLGIGAKAGLLKLKKVGFTRSVAGITSEIIYDIMITVIITIIYLLSHPSVFEKKIFSFFNFGFLFLFILLATIFIFLIFYFRKHEIIERYVHNVMKSFWTKGFFINIVLSCLIWFSAGASVVFIFMAQNFKLDIWLATFGSAFAFLLSLATMIPGGLGVRDITRANIYTFANIAYHSSIALTLILRFLHLITIVILIGILNIGKYINKKSQEEVFI